MNKETCFEGDVSVVATEFHLAMRIGGVTIQVAKSIRDEAERILQCSVAAFYAPTEQEVYLLIPAAE